MKRYLQDHRLIGERIAQYHAQTRDRADLAVYRCEDSGVIFLDNATGGLDAYYSGKEIDNDGLQSITQIGEVKVSTAMIADSERRVQMFRNTYAGKSVCDFGAGHGRFLRRIGGLARSACGVELNERQIADLRRDGFRVERSIEDFDASSFDVVTLFHVLEHLADPIETLARIRTRMKPGAKLIVEVPHARDFVHRTLASEAFKNFTFWSEHLVLHTRESLGAVIGKAGFSEIQVRGLQRYGLENHLHWLVERRHGGHERWEILADSELNTRYAALLQSLDQTDTLIATASF
jgi:2-polyprenyl-3-methyl-5-hydroxy-6-metoxy-1,4-benzoquinol methylase